MTNDKLTLEFIRQVSERHLEPDDQILFEDWLNKNQGLVKSASTMTHNLCVTHLMLTYWVIDALEEQNESIEFSKKQVELYKQKIQAMKWKKVQLKRAARAKESKLQKLQELEKYIIKIMGANSGMRAQKIANEIEAQFKAKGLIPPYSCTPDKNGKTSLLRAIESILPKIRMKIEHAPNSHN